MLEFFCTVSVPFISLPWYRDQQANQINQQLELKMFYQTQTIRRPPKSPPCSDRMVPSASAWRYLHWAHYNASCSRTDHSVTAGGDGSAQRVFCPWWPWPWPMTSTFKLVWARDRTRLPYEFGTNMFSGSSGIWFTNKQQKSQFTACGNKTYSVGAPDGVLVGHPSCYVTGG